MNEWFGGGRSSRPLSAAMINNKDTLISYQSSRYAVKTRNHWDIWSRKGPCIRFGRVFRAQADKPTPLKLGDLMKLVHAIQLASFSN
jgi:hypothetical protein